MKKKLVVFSVVAVLLLSLGVVAFAENTKDVPEWFNEMISWKRNQVEEAVKSGELTEDQAKEWNQRIDSMEQSRLEKGFNFPMGCTEGGNQKFRNNFRNENRRGPGMMKGFGWKGQQ